MAQFNRFFFFKKHVIEKYNFSVFLRATRKGRIDEAVQYHKEAADILNELLQNILDEKVAESVRLQAQLHEKGMYHYDMICITHFLFSCGTTFH